MKKVIGLSLTFLVLIFAFTAYAIGYFFEKNYDHTLQLLAQNLQLNLKVIEYKRSWFHSDAIVAANFPLADKPIDMRYLNKDQGQFLVVHQRIYHGPFILYHTPKHTGVKFATVFIDSFFDPNSHFAETMLQIDSSITTDFALNQFAFIKNSKVLYSLNGLEGNYRISANKIHVSTNIKLKHLFANLDTPREISDFNASKDLTKNKFDLWTGKNIYHFGMLKWQQDDKQFALNNFSFIIDSRLQHSHYKADITSNIQGAFVNNVNYGTQTISLNIFNLNGEEFKQLQDLLPTGGAQDENMKVGQFQQQMMTVLNKGVDIKINNLTLNTAWGQAHLIANFSCPCRNTAENFVSLLPNIDSELRGQVPVELANVLLSNYFLFHQHPINQQLANTMAKEILLTWERKGWLKNTGGNFWVELNWKKAQSIH